MGENCIYGTLPSEMFKLLKLKELYVEWNYLSGLVSDELYRLSSLVHLDLSGNANDASCNRTGGDIPIDISSNGLEGDILGPNIGKLTKLQELKVIYTETILTTPLLPK
jgi:hypothetical protein